MWDLSWCRGGAPHFALCCQRKKSAALHGNGEEAAGLSCFYVLPWIHWSFFLPLGPTLPRTGTRK